MGNHSGKRELLPGEPAKEAETHEGEAASPQQPCHNSLSPDSPEDNDVFGEADVNQNNELGRPPRKGPAVTASTGAAEPRGGWPKASPADPGGRPHLVRLFSRDAPGREDNTFKERPSESDELQPIREDGGATAPADDAEMMASQKRSSQRHGSKYLATASGLDHGRHGYRPRHRDTGFLDSLGRFFGGDRSVPRRGAGKEMHGSRTGHYGSLPHKSQHGRPCDDNPVVHFFKNIVSPRTPPPAQAKGRGLGLTRFSWGAEGPKSGYGYGYGGRTSDYKAAHKGYKGGYQTGQGTLSRIFKLGGRDSRSGSPMARR
ncbi:myelin basic protein isoform X1 [Ornithorhynchus anatinus]|uniref:Myelin basic protein n=1 Tax=Ornithorhynchus anatinus TaxID=9258 RepID=A0A6I8P793_ORNAN|nr:myelin basic protein isoform X1 [Ornithorhynchus anatinus]